MKFDNLFILVAEDDEDDRMLQNRAFKQGCSGSKVQFVHDGLELLRYLRREEPYNNPEEYPHPKIVLLDLNMPYMDGRQSLVEIKNDEQLKKIPVVVFTTSAASSDVEFAYQNGCNSYIVKPSTYTELVEMAQTLEKYWFQISKTA